MPIHRPALLTRQRLNIVFYFWRVVLAAFQALAILLKIVFAPLGLLFATFVGLPVALFTVKQNRLPFFRTIEESALPEPAWLYIDSVCDALRFDGFETMGYFQTDTLSANEIYYLCLLVNRRKMQVAAVIYLNVMQKDKIVQTRQFVEFSTEFTDGPELNMNNADVNYAMPAPAYIDRIQFRSAWGARHLYALYEKVLAADSRQSHLAHVQALLDNPQAILTESLQKEIKSYIDTGYLKTVGDVCRITFKGARTSIYRLVWPTSAWHARRIDRLTRQRLLTADISASQIDSFDYGMVLPPLKLAMPISNMHQLLAQAKVLADKVSPHVAPVSAEVELSKKDGQLQIQNGAVTYEGERRHAQRQSLHHIYFSIYYDCTSNTLTVMSYSSALIEPGEIPARANISDMTTLLDIDKLDAQLQTEVARRLQMPAPSLRFAELYNDYGELKWKLTYEADTKFGSLIVNAATGEILDFAGTDVELVADKP